MVLASQLLRVDVARSPLIGADGSWSKVISDEMLVELFIDRRLNAIIIIF